MNTLLDQIRDIVKSVKDDKEKLQQIVNYLESEIIEEEEKLEESNNAVDELPDKYKPIVNEIAQYIDMGMLCFFISSFTRATVLLIVSALKNQFPAESLKQHVSIPMEL